MNPTQNEPSQTEQQAFQNLLDMLKESLRKLKRARKGLNGNKKQLEE